MLTLGTGIGSATFIDGKLYLGNGFGSESGQILINGKRFEELASGSSQINIAKKHGLGKLIGKSCKS